MDMEYIGWDGPSRNFDYNPYSDKSEAIDAYKLKEERRRLDELRANPKVLKLKLPKTKENGKK